MASKPTFSQEVANLLHASHGDPFKTCIQCGTCAGTCPVVEFMDHTPRRLIAMINADLKEDVLAQQYLLVLCVLFPLQRQMPKQYRYCSRDVCSETLLDVAQNIPGGTGWTDVL